MHSSVSSFAACVSLLRRVQWQWRCIGYRYGEKLNCIRERFPSPRAIELNFAPGIYFLLKLNFISALSQSHATEIDAVEWLSSPRDIKSEINQSIEKAWIFSCMICIEFCLLSPFTWTVSFGALRRHIIRFIARRVWAQPWKCGAQSARKLDSNT